MDFDIPKLINVGFKDTVNAIKLHCRGVAKHHPIVEDFMADPEAVKA